MELYHRKMEWLQMLWNWVTSHHPDWSEPTRKSLGVGMTHGDSSRAWQCLLSFLSFFFLCHGLETVFIASVSPQTGTRLQFLAEGQSLFSLLQAQFILDSGGLAYSSFRGEKLHLVGESVCTWFCTSCSLKCNPSAIPISEGRPATQHREGILFQKMDLVGNLQVCRM